MSEESKLTVVLGATSDPSRYAYLAAEKLKKHDQPFKLVSIKKGILFGEPFLDLKSKPPIDDVHTVTLYIGAARLDEWKEYVLSLHPKRIIFNPGTENMTLAKAAESEGIEIVFGCTLVMLGTGQY
ncbi:CoA-binding protein [Reichenbachiella carrageenanivorans]|uniref:CoA-binding protein n=1 Tax=Reichenbachiella carrageenanivorans TaxID=2979869 RepID=A0ABY6D096_9BACT|nr:CoA-binding protein [Reichenbachiella carrageenanivorans]UXX79586.1 CoA-binding protein [Reichenbachiella carrageenanivorans]